MSKLKGPPPKVIHTGNPSDIMEDIFRKYDRGDNTVNVQSEEELQYISEMVRQIQNKLTSVTITIDELYNGLVNTQNITQGLGDTFVYTDVVSRNPDGSFPDKFITLSVTGPTPWVKVREMHWVKDNCKQLEFTTHFQTTHVSEYNFYHREVIPGFAVGFFYTKELMVPLRMEQISKLYNYLFRQD